MEKPTLWKSLHYKYCSCNLGFKISGNITSVLCLQGFSFILLLLFLIGWFSAFNLMQLLYVWKCLSFCVEQPPSFCVQCITNGKFYSFLKILNQAKTKIWFFLSHWDDDIFLSCSLPSEWCFHILLWQERENKLSENLLSPAGRSSLKTGLESSLCLLWAAEGLVDVGVLSEWGCVSYIQ